MHSSWFSPMRHFELDSFRRRFDSIVVLSILSFEADPSQAYRNRRCYAWIECHLHWAISKCLYLKTALRQNLAHKMKSIVHIYICMYCSGCLEFHRSVALNCHQTPQIYTFIHSFIHSFVWFEWCLYEVFRNDIILSDTVNITFRHSLRHCPNRNSNGSANKQTNTCLFLQNTIENEARISDCWWRLKRLHETFDIKSNCIHWIAYIDLSNKFHAVVILKKHTQFHSVSNARTTSRINTCNNSSQKNSHSPSLSVCVCFFLANLSCVFNSAALR